MQQWPTDEDAFASLSSRRLLVQETGTFTGKVIVRTRFNIISGVAQHRASPRRQRTYHGNPLPDDLSGLSEEGKYTNSSKARAPSTAYRLPLPASRSRLSKMLRWNFTSFASFARNFVKRSATSFLLSERSAIARRMFLQLLEQLQLLEPSRSRKSICRWIAPTSASTPEGLCGPRAGPFGA